MAVVVFQYAGWATRYPELAPWVTEPMAQSYFSEAGLYCDNTTTSPIIDETTRAMLLNMCVAHIAKLSAPINGQAPSGLVGRMSNVTEGSVSLSIENNYPPGTVQWWQQTPYGAQFWAATEQYRRMFYVAQPYRVVDPYAPWGGTWQ